MTTLIPNPEDPLILAHVRSTDRKLHNLLRENRIQTACCVQFNATQNKPADRILVQLPNLPEEGFRGFVQRELDKVPGDLMVSLAYVDYEPGVDRPREHLDSFPVSDFLDAGIPYHNDEIELMARMATVARLELMSHPSGAEAQLAAWGLGRPNSRYPAYGSRIEAAQIMHHVNEMNEIAGFDTQICNLYVRGNRHPAEEYARVVQALQWQRALSPETFVVPAFQVLDRGGPDAREPVGSDFASAWAQACYDCGQSEFLLWHHDADPRMWEAAQEVIPAFAAGLAD